MRLAIGLIGAMGLGLTAGRHAQAQSAVNLALGKVAVFEPAPKYRHCADAGDPIQLTDGVTAGSNWLNSSTVGWGRESVPLRVTFDLGSTRRVAEVRVNTVGGGRANVFYPANIVAFTGDGESTVRPVGSCDSLDLAQRRFDPLRASATPHVFTIRTPGAAGRFVHLLLVPDGDFVFLDEVEIIAADEEPTEPTAPPPTIPLKDAVTLLPSARERAMWRAALDRLDNALGGSARNELNAEVAALRRAGDEASLTSFPVWTELNRRAAELRANSLRAITGKSLLVTEADPVVALRTFDPPLPELLATAEKNERPRLRVETWRGEFESLSVNAMNTSDETVRLLAAITPFRRADGSVHPSGGVTLRHAHGVAAHGAGRIGDALVKWPDFGVTLAPGEATQLFLVFHDDDLPAGEYAFALDLTAIGADGEEIAHEMLQGDLVVAPLKMPSKARLRTCVWSYPERAEATKNVPAEAARDMRDHYVNTQVMFWSSSLPMPKLNVRGEVEFDFAKFDTALERYGPVDQYLFYWGLGVNRRQLPNMGAPLSPEWKNGLRTWLNAWVARLRDRGIDYDRFAMYPFDEMIPAEFVDMAKFIKEVDPRIRIYANSRGDEEGTELTRIAPYIDVWCFRDLPVGGRMSESEKKIRKSGMPVWSYDVARPAKGKPPLGYYRMQMWRAFARGDQGCGFWVYADPGIESADAWDDLASPDGKYSIIYGLPGKPEGLDLSGESLVPSRRWEAWRDGVEDFEYLSRLRDGVQAARQQGRWTEADAAQALLSRVVREVLDSSENGIAVRSARREITASILSLESGKP